MSSEQDNRLMKEFSKLKTKYLDLERENEILTEKIMFLNEKVKCKENQRTKLIKMCSEKISNKNDVIESLQNENKHLQDIITSQNEQIMEQDKTIENLRNTTNLQTTVIKHPCFENDKVRIKKERNKSQVRFPHLQLTISRRTPKIINGNRQRRKLYISEDETVDLSN